MSDESGMGCRSSAFHVRKGGRTVNSWRLIGAWPCRWSGPSFNALDSQIAYEELELAFDDLVWLEQRETPRKPTTTHGG